MDMAFFSFSALSKDLNKHFEKKKGKNGHVRRKIFYNDEEYDGGYKLQVESGEGQSDGDGFQDGGEVCYRNSMTMRNLMVVGTKYR